MMLNRLQDGRPGMNEKTVIRAVLIGALATLNCAGVACQTPTAGTLPSQSPEIDRDLFEVTSRNWKSSTSHTSTPSPKSCAGTSRASRNTTASIAPSKLSMQPAPSPPPRTKTPRRTGEAFQRGPLWGVPIVIKANTSVKGLVTTDGWKGYMIPGHELIAPRDATIVAKLRAAGAIILGQTNMPDFAASDTNRSTAFGRTGNAYDVRFSPGGSSGGTVTAVTANFAVLGNGTDTGNSIRMPAATSAVVGVLPDARPGEHRRHRAARLAARQHRPHRAQRHRRRHRAQRHGGEDPLDSATAGSSTERAARALHAISQAGRAQGQTLRRARLHSRRRRHSLPGHPAAKRRESRRTTATARLPLRPETRAAFMRLSKPCAPPAPRSSSMTPSFPTVSPRAPPHRHAALRSRGYRKLSQSLRPAAISFGRRVRESGWLPLARTIIGGANCASRSHSNSYPRERPRPTATSRGAAPRHLQETLDRLHLDGFVYPAIQMPPPDETMPQDGELSAGPHSDTSWVNMIGVPAVVVPAGFHPNGLLRPRDLRPPLARWRPARLGLRLRTGHASSSSAVLVESGLLPDAR